MGPTVRTYLLCDVEERLHPQLEILQLLSSPRAIVRLRRPSGPGRRRTPWHLPVDHGVRVLANRDPHRRRRLSGGHPVISIDRSNNKKENEKWPFPLPPPGLPSGLAGVLWLPGKLCWWVPHCPLSECLFFFSGTRGSWRTGCKRTPVAASKQIICWCFDSGSFSCSPIRW